MLSCLFRPADGDGRVPGEGSSVDWSMRLIHMNKVSTDLMNSTFTSRTHPLELDEVCERRLQCRRRLEGGVSSVACFFFQLTTYSDVLPSACGSLVDSACSGRAVCMMAHCASLSNEVCPSDILSSSGSLLLQSHAVPVFPSRSVVRVVSGLFGRQETPLPSGSSVAIPVQVRAGPARLSEFCAGLPH